MKVNVTSNQGHDVELFDDVAEGKTFIKDKMVNEDRWAFIEGQMIQDPNEIDAMDLDPDAEVTMQYRMVGGLE